MAFDTGTEPVPVDPFVDRFDKTMAGFEGSPQKMFVDYKLLSIVLDLWKGNPEIFTRMASGVEALRDVIDVKRNMSGKAKLVEDFTGSLRNKLASHGLREPQGKMQEFGKWIYEDPRRCPGLRLGYETTAKLTANREDVPEEGDAGDLCYVRATPYVHAVTLDRRMRGYSIQASRRLRAQKPEVIYENRIFKNVEDLMKRLSSDPVVHSRTQDE